MAPRMNLRASERGFPMRMNSKARRQFRAGKIRFLFSRIAADRFGESGIVYPKRDFVGHAASAKERLPAPVPLAARAEDDDPRHYRFLLLAKRKARLGAFHEALKVAVMLVKSPAERWPAFPRW